MKKLIATLGAIALAAGMAGCSTSNTTAKPSESASPRLVSTTVTVTGDGTATQVTVTVGGTVTTESNVKLPYKKTIKTPKHKKVSVQAQNGTSTGDLTATVTKNGETQTDTASGEFATVQAGGTSGVKADKDHKGAEMGTKISQSPSPLPSAEATIK